MENFCLEHYLQRAEVWSTKCGGRPVIGLTTNHQDIDATLRERYYLQVVAAGGIPVLVPPIDDEAVVMAYTDIIDGLLLTGGGDCDPRWMGEEPRELLGNVNEVRDLPELLLARLARNKNIPTFGICRGMQMMAIAYGGKVNQDISLDPLWERDKGILHSQVEARDVTTHSVLIAEGSILRALYGRERMDVNSFHHQSMGVLPQGFRATAWSDDGIVEAFEGDGDRPYMGVQWHPEWLAEDGRSLFEWLIAEARLYKEAKRLHERIVSIDSHCDTPMFFAQGVDFTSRDDRVKVDLCKMTDGRLDVATMAAYVPQPIGEQTWQDVMPIATSSAFDYANLIFDRTEALLATSRIPVAMARKSDDVVRNKCCGQKSIMLAIENALAIGDDMTKLKHFKDRGVVYMTLCHNGDNAVCDSSQKSLRRWDGLSPFGEEVVREMERLGMMIDLSHASERTFYDVLQVAKGPVVCSHSNCRALCDHPRNLTDDQMRCLAAKGGVCQLTLYDGFVSRNAKEADVLSFVEHVVHAANVMGVEHIGIGSDFDGDGGVMGLTDAGEMMLFTRQLLKNHFDVLQIEAIWGGNWLRVMDEVQCMNGIEI